VTTEIIDDFGQVRDADHGLITGSIAREWYSIHPDDPLSARAKAHWTQTLDRDGWSVRTETYCEMWSDADTFYITAALNAYDENEMCFSKEFNETVRRNGV
jgi:hypothetical protein